MSDDWPGGFVSAKTLRDVEQNDQDVTIFNDHGVRYMNGGNEERDDSWLYMENMPSSLENKC